VVADDVVIGGLRLPSMGVSNLMGRWGWFRCECVCVREREGEGEREREREAKLLRVGSRDE